MFITLNLHGLRGPIFSWKIIDFSVSGKNLEIVHGGILNNKRSDEKESPTGKESEGNLKLQSCMNSSFHDSICFRHTLVTFHQPKQLIEFFYIHPHAFFYILADLH